jgi:hypothetical protein
MATAVGVASCRKHLPRPEDGMIFTRSGGSGGTGAGGNDGTGGTMVDARDMAPVPDVVDMRETGTPEVPPACGLGGQACCPGNECRSGGCCEDGTCTAQFDPCRSIGGAACVSGGCGGMCGAPAVSPLPPAPCCERQTCTRAFSVCTGTGRGTCVDCGGAGQPCCTNAFCKPGNTCANMVCGATPSTINPP